MTTDGLNELPKAPTRRTRQDSSADGITECLRSYRASNSVGGLYPQAP